MADPVVYMRMELENGHLFIFDQEATHRISATLRPLIEELYWFPVSGNS